MSGASGSFPVGWSGVVGANGSGKTTLLRLTCGLIAPTSGVVSIPGDALLCEQRTDDAPSRLEEFLLADDRAACALRGRLGLDASWCTRWDTLSHGERKRAQIADALWRNPCVLAIDEPTNHLDVDGRAMVLRALQSFGGIGLLVSHDRDLLDQLCTQCVFVDPPSITCRPGNYSDASAQARLERDTLRRERAEAARDLHALRAEANKRRVQTAIGERQRSKSGLDPKDHDMRAKIDLARVTDSGSGQRLRQLDGRVEQARRRFEQAACVRDWTTGIALPGTCAPRRFLATLEPGSLPLGPERNLEHPAIAVRPDDRIAIVGPNGMGKSTFVRHLVDNLAIPSDRVVFLPQEVPLEQGRELLRGFHRLRSQQLGLAMSIVRRLGTDPERLLRSAQPSPGEIRKLLLAGCASAEPYLLVLDEPTNHLDLPAIECLEDALEGCSAALILVSHEQRFLRRLARTWWAVEPVDAATTRLVCGDNGT